MMNIMEIEEYKAIIQYDLEIEMFRGKFNLRVPANLHAEVVVRAAAAGKSLNQWLVDLLSENIHVHD